jgi:AraC family transcriptional regulator of adaptative response / DNA-3-methyladenine glycosylase II
MRALSDPDAFLPSDVGVLEALARLGAVPAGTGPSARARAARAAAALAQSWRPWRSYAVHHLWASLEEEKDAS